VQKLSFLLYREGAILFLILDFRFWTLKVLLIGSFSNSEDIPVQGFPRQCVAGVPDKVALAAIAASGIIPPAISHPFVATAVPLRGLSVMLRR